MAVTVDGSAAPSGAVLASSSSVTLSTSKTNDVIVVVASSRRGSSATSVSSVSDTAGLSWAQRAAATLTDSGANFHIDVELWRAFSSAALSGDKITVTFGATATEINLLAFGLNGSQSSPSDANGSLPASASAIGPSPAVSGISTTSANDLVIGVIYSAA